MNEQGIERRRWPRISASSVGMSAAIIGGPDASLVDLSRGGALLEVAGRLTLGSSVRLKLIKSGRELPIVNGRVAWQKVASIAAGQINYRVAVAFNDPLEELVPADTTDAAAEIEEPPAVPRARGNAVVQFPSTASQPTATARSVAATPTAALAAAPPAGATDAEIETLRKRLAAAKSDLACQAAVLESLATKLRESEQQRTALIRQVAEAQQRGDSLQAAWDAREQEHAQLLREREHTYDAIVAELMKAANDQQAEFQALLDEQQRSQEEAARCELEARRELEARVEAAEALCAGQQDRYRALRRETEKLMSMIDGASDCGLDVTEPEAAAS